LKIADALTTGARRQQRVLVLVPHGSWRVLAVVFHGFLIPPSKKLESIVP
jgi:hypothetical protein